MRPQEDRSEDPKHHESDAMPRSYVEIGTERNALCNNIPFLTGHTTWKTQPSVYSGLKVHITKTGMNEGKVLSNDALKTFHSRYMTSNI